MAQLSAQITQSDVMAARFTLAVNYDVEQNGLTHDQVINHLFDHITDPHVRADLTHQKHQQYARGARLLQTLKIVTSPNPDTIRTTTAPLIRIDTPADPGHVYATLWPLEAQP